MRLVTLTFVICAALAIAAPGFAGANEDPSKTTTEKTDETKGETTPPAKKGDDGEKSDEMEKDSK